MRSRLTIVWLVALASVASAQQHSQCWLEANGWLNSGSNLSPAEVKAAMQSLGAA
jgi:hypothetical protein